MSYGAAANRRSGERATRATEQYDYDDQDGREAHSGGGTDARPAPRAKKQRRLIPAGYTFGHGTSQVRVGPVAFWTIVGALVVMGCWTVVTATYFAFEDDVLGRLVARQAELQFAYEDRIADMRAQVDRVTSRQLLDQEQFEQKLDQLAKRQAMLEARAATLSGGDPAATGSIKRDPSATPGKPTPLGERSSMSEPRGLSGILARITGRTGGGGINGTFARLQDSLDRVDQKETASLAAMEESYDSKARRISGVLSELGVSVPKPAQSASGGPFIPARPGDQISFERRLQRVSVVRSQVERLHRTLINVPVRKPIPGDIDLSSGFGVRSDPFVGRPAMHTGLDFRGDSGEPVYPTAAGTVTTAGWNGGYGKMIEVDHGNGFATRYGHLSEIDVKVGQTVRIGQVIGKIGSTGRSTGPHLHYETRIEGDAVDPHRFLRAGEKLGLGS